MHAKKLGLLAIAAGASLIATVHAQDAQHGAGGHMAAPPHMPAPPSHMAPSPHGLPPSHMASPTQPPSVPHPGPMIPAPVRPTQWVRPLHFEHHDFARFTSHERSVWIAGHWSHGWHHHHHGWWWFVGGTWFFYPEPIYPYPTYVSPEYFEEAPNVYGDYWYYCDNPQGYWPYVGYCNEPWEQIPVTPPSGISPGDVE